MNPGLQLAPRDHTLHVALLFNVGAALEMLILLQVTRFVNQNATLLVIPWAPGVEDPEKCRCELTRTASARSFAITMSGMRYG